MTATAKPFVIESPYTFLYDTEGPVTAAALAESLIGLDGMAGRAAFALRALSPDLGRIRHELLVRDVAIGSYKEQFWFRFIFGTEKNAEKKLEQLRRRLHLDAVNGSPVAIASVVAVGLVAYGVWQFAKPDPVASVLVNNGLLAIGSSINLPADQFEAVLDTASPNKEELRRDTVRIVRPAGLEKTGVMTLKAGDISVSLPHQALEPVPVEYTKREPQTVEIKLTNAPAIIRALDLDRAGQGWAGVLPEISEKRMPVELGKDVSPSAIPPGKIIYGNVTLIQAVDRKGEKTPKRFVLEKIVPYEEVAR